MSYYCSTIVPSGRNITSNEPVSLASVVSGVSTYQPVGVARAGPGLRKHANTWAILGIQGGFKQETVQFIERPRLTHRHYHYDP